MAEFTAITTQEEFDAAIKSRLERERNKYSEQLAGFDETKNQLAEAQKQINDLSNALKDANDKVANHDAEIAERDTKIRSYEIDSVKTKVANEMGLSYEAIGFIQGDDEDTIRKSAEGLKNLVGTKAVAPLKSDEPSIANDSEAQKNAELRKMLTQLRKGD